MVKETPYPEVPPQYPQPVYASHMYPQYATMQHSSRGADQQIGRKIKATFLCAVAFVILSYGGTYRVINNIAGTFTSTPFGGVTDDGCPTIKGVFLHTVLFFIIAFFFISNV